MTKNEAIIDIFEGVGNEDLIEVWNDATGTCGENEYIYTMEEFDDICDNIPPSELIQDAYDGDADMNDDYFSFSEVGHNPTAIITFNDPWENIQSDVLVDYAIHSNDKALRKIINDKTLFDYFYQECFDECVDSKKVKRLLNKMIKEGSDNLVAGDWDTIADAIADKL